MKTNKPISQNSIARALGLCNSSITKLKKMGMPTDTVEAAVAWRKQNLHPARTKIDWPSVVAEALGVTRDSVIQSEVDI